MPANRQTEWFDNDRFWIDTYPFMFPEERFASADAQVERILEICQPPGIDALDLCCGPGRCSVALAQRGYRVTGVDRTPFLLDKARERAAATQSEIEFVLQDMRDFSRPLAFDLVLSMFTSFGYFDDKDDDRKVLDRVFASLRPGGVFLIDLMGKERFARIYTPSSVDTLPDGSMLVQEREIFDDWTRIRNQWVLIRDGHATSYTFHHSIYSGQELRDLLQSAGFRDIDFYGNLDGDPYGVDATRLIAIARRPYARRTAGQVLSRACQARR